MYLQHFGLRRSPFTAAPDPRLFHPIRAHVKALEQLVESIRLRHRLVGLQAPEGAGKTLLVRLLAAELRERQQVVVIEPAARRLGGLAAAISRSLGFDIDQDVHRARSRVEQHLLQQGQQRQATTVVVDDADTLPDGWLAEIESLVASSAPLTLIAVYRDRLGAASRARVASRLEGMLEQTVTIGGIEPSECGGYLQALLMNAGARSPRLFDDGAVSALQALGNGLPGRLAEIADRALLVAFGRAADGVDEAAVLAAADQIGSGKLAPHVRRGLADDSVQQFEAPILIHRPKIEVVADEAMAYERLASMPRAMAASGGGAGVETFGNAWSTGVAMNASSRVATGPRVVEERAPTPVDPERARELLAGIRRPDRPTWDRAKHDPYRSPLSEAAPFGPEMLAVVSDPHGDVAEWFRVLRLSIEDWMSTQSEERPVVLVTSAEPLAGKTFVAANLALLFANEPGHRVLLVDGDMRRPRFETLFGVPSRPGLADVLAGRSDLRDAVQYISEVGLFVLPAGRSGNPRDLVSPDRLAPLMREMRQDADLIIIDSPPMGAWVDARALASAADGVLFVARSGRTRATELSRSLRTLDRDNLIGAVLTGFAGRQTERSHGDSRRHRS